MGGPENYLRPFHLSGGKMFRSFTTRYAIAIILIAGAMCSGGYSLAQQQPARPGVPAAPPAVQVDPQPVAIGGAVGSPTYVIPPGPPQKNGGFIHIGQAFSDFLGPYIDAAIEALAVAFVGWVANGYRRVTGRELDQKHRDALQVAFKNRAASLIAAGKVKVNALGVQVPDAELAVEANDLMAAMKDAVEHFGGMSPELVKQKIIDAIPQIPAGASIIAQAHLREPVPTAKAS